MISIISNFLKNFKHYLFSKYNVFVTITYTAIFFIFSKWLLLGFTDIIYINFFILTLVVSAIFRSQQKLTTESAKGQICQEIVFSYL